ncbi:MAG: D-hexose-6-phosphate mutarotase [Ardenticatenaceae bacterium]
MKVINIDDLNTLFSIPGHITFKAGPGGLPVAEIANAHALATVALHGGHVTAFEPRGQQAVLWVSRLARYKLGKAIRGGIPVIWPWFGPHATDRNKPSHGFARTTMWRVVGSDVLANQATQIRLAISDNERTHALWPHAFELEVVITVGKTLQVELVMRNRGDEPFTCSGALHSYFKVSDVTDIAIHGLEDGTYIDQLDDFQRKVQQGAVTISAETDRIYLDSPADCVIDDPGLSRRIRIQKSGSRSTVVWNPWRAKAQRTADFGDQEYPEMLCIETANAGDDLVTVPAGGEHRLTAIISVEQ